MKFYKCEICGKVIAMIKDTGVDTICCGQPMRELVPGTTDGAAEKHVPVYTVTDRTVTVKVGSTAHPMTDAHHIEWVVLETEYGYRRKDLKPGDEPVAKFELMPFDKVKSVYAYCNLHGLWKT